MDPLPEHEIIGGLTTDEEKQRVLDRLRHNDPTLKELTIGRLEHRYEVLDAIATNSSLKVLDLHAWTFLDDHRAKDRLTRALITNTSVKHVLLHLCLCRNTMPGCVTKVLDIIRASPNLETLTLQMGDRLSIEDIAAMVQGLCVHTNLRSLTITRFLMNSNRAAAFAAAFQANQTIKTLIMGWCAIERDARVSFVEALPHDHSLETIIFDGDKFGDDNVVSIVRILCHKRLKTLSLLNSRNNLRRVSQDGYERIVQTLRENDHGFTKLDPFPNSKDSPWQNKIRLEIEMLTWKNRLQVEKDTWVDRFLEQDGPSKELLFCALERAKNVDNGQFSKAPNLLFHLIKESPELIAQATRDGL